MFNETELPETANSPQIEEEVLNLSLIFEADSQVHGQDGDTTAEHETEVQRFDCDDEAFNLSHFFEIQVQEEPDDVQDLGMLSNPQVQGEPDDAQGQYLGMHEQEADTSAQRPVSDDTEAFNSSLIFGVDSKELGQDDDTTAGHAHKLDCHNTEAFSSQVEDTQAEHDQEVEGPDRVLNPPHPASVQAQEEPGAYGLEDNMEHSTGSSQGTKVTLGAGGQAERLISEPQSILKPAMLLVLIASTSLGIMGSALDIHPGSTATHMGDHVLNTCGFPAWSATSCQIHGRARKEHALNGKYPPDSVRGRPTMEVDPKTAVEKILELVAIILLTFTSIALGLMLGLAASWIIWNSAYLRSLLRGLFTVQHDDVLPVPMAHVRSIHEGDSSSDSSDDEDDDTAVASEQVSAHKEQGPQAQQ